MTKFGQAEYGDFMARMFADKLDEIFKVSFWFPFSCQSDTINPRCLLLSVMLQGVPLLHQRFRPF